MIPAVHPPLEHSPFNSYGFLDAAGPAAAGDIRVA